MLFIILLEFIIYSSNNKKKCARCALELGCKRLLCTRCSYLLHVKCSKIVLFDISKPELILHASQGLGFTRSQNHISLALIFEFQLKYK